MTLSDAVLFALDLGRQVIDNDTVPSELPRAQKLLIQRAMESLLILKDAHLSNPEHAMKITERAKKCIQNTLHLTEPLP